MKHFGVDFCHSKGSTHNGTAINNQGGELLSYVGRTLGDRYTRHPKFNPGLELYNLHRAKQTPQLTSRRPSLFPCLSFLDIWYLSQEHRLENAVALLGDSMATEQSELFRELFPSGVRAGIQAPAAAPEIPSRIRELAPSRRLLRFVNPADLRHSKAS